MYLAGRQDRLGMMLRAIAVAGCLAAVYGISQYFGWDPWLSARAYRAGEGIWTIVRPPGTMGHADYFAAYLVFVVFAGVTLVAGENGAWKYLGWGAVALGSIAIVLSGTRGASLGEGAGALFLAIRLRPRISIARVAAVMGIALLAAAFYLSPAGLRLRSRVHWISEDTGGGARLLLWRDSLRFASTHSLAGAGPETFSAEFPRFQSAELARAYPDFYYESPHNLFLDTWAAQGIAGVGILLGLIALGMAAGFRSAPLCAALVACVVTHFFTVLIVPTALCFYVNVAMLVSMQSEPVAVRWRWAAVPVSAVMIFFAIRLLAADRSLELARRDLESGRIMDVVVDYRNGREWGLSADIWYARSLAAVAPDEALAAARRATAGEDAQNAFYTVAWMYARQGDVPHTEQALRNTLACAPNWFKPHWMLSQVLQRQGRTREAQAEAERAAYLDGGKHPEVSHSAEALRAAVQSR
jgi:hypothetical protein